MLKSIKMKLLFIGVLPVLLTVLLTTIVTMSLTYENSKETLANFETSIMKEKKELLKNEIFTIVTIINGILKEAPSLDVAKEKIIALSSNARFLDGSGYFFAYEQKDGEYYFAFHGTKTQLNGKKTDISKPDIKGFAFRRALIDSNRDDSKFIEYFYKKPNTDKIIKKMAFSKYIPELNWTVVTGIYLDDIEEILKKVEEKNDKIANSLIITMVSIIVVMLILILIVISYISKISIVNPLATFERGLLSFLQFLNKESSDASLIEITTKDEIGNMTAHINENITKIKESIKRDNELIKDVSKTVSEVSRGVLSNRVNSSSSNETINELISNLNLMIEQLHKRVENALSVLSSYEKRDFRAKIEISAQGELNSLIKGINSLGVEISRMLKYNLDSGESLDVSAKELNVNVQRLTTSANQQAASLEETAASLEEITSTMRQSDSSMSELSNYAKELSVSVKKGQELTNQTTKSMEDINEQVSAINDSITVIDNISFQTNILSLNAAVEAATAGESGKGFAVVAGEVRNLATRSAEAAKEIKDLVESATVGANKGKDIAKEMFGGYEQLNSNIENTIEIVSNVANNSKEQMKGIEQINSAISQLDQATQENSHVATKTNEIANSTSTLATKILDEAKKSQFIGK